MCIILVIQFFGDLVILRNQTKCSKLPGECFKFSCADSSDKVGFQGFCCKILLYSRLIYVCVAASVSQVWNCFPIQTCALSRTTLFRDGLCFGDFPV